MKKETFIYILIISAVLRLISLNQSFWLDEATTATVAGRINQSVFFGQFLPGDFHPPLYYLLTRAWATVFGAGEVSLRSISVIAGMGVVYLCYKIATHIKNETAGMVAALLAGTGPLLIYYSQEARGYMLAALLATSAVYAYLVASSRKRVNPKQWLIFGLILPLIFLTDYLALLVLPAVWALELSKKRISRAFLLSHIPLFLSFIAWWPVLSEQLANGLAVKGSNPGWWQALGVVSVKNIALIPVKFLIGRVGFDNPLLYVAALIFPALIYSFLIHKAIKSKKRKSILIAWIVVPLTVAILMSLFVPVLAYFRLLFALPAMYVLAALGLTEVKDRNFLPLLLLVLVFNIVFAGIYLFNTKYHREDWRSLVAYTQESSGEMSFDVVFVRNSQQEAYKVYSEKETTTAEGITGETDNLYLMRYVQDVYDPEDTVRKKVEEHYNFVEERDFNGIIVWKYERSEHEDRD